MSTSSAEAPKPSSASYAIDPSCRVDDFINVVKLQSVMNSLVARLEAQQSQIARLEDEIKYNCVSKRAFDTYSATMNTRLTKIEESIFRWSGAWKRIEDAADVIEGNVLKLKEVTDGMALKADLADFAQFKAETHLAMDRRHEELLVSRASNAAVGNLEDSQHRILEEIVAVQQLIACKVDRVEIPLLSAAADKLQRAVTFQEEALPRLTRLEEAAITTARVLGQKEDKEAVVQRMQHLHKELQVRPEFNWLNSRVIDPVDCLQKDVSQLLQAQDTMAKALQRVDQLSKQMEEVNSTAAGATQGFDRMDAVLKEALAEMRSKPSIEVLSEKLEERDRAMDQILKQHVERGVADAKLQLAYTADLRAQLLEVARHYASLEKKVGVALKFIDWFTDVKLKGSSFDRDYVAT